MCEVFSRSHSLSLVLNSLRSMPKLSQKWNHPKSKWKSRLLSCFSIVKCDGVFVYSKQSSSIAFQHKLNHRLSRTHSLPPKLTSFQTVKEYLEVESKIFFLQTITLKPSFELLSLGRALAPNIIDNVWRKNTVKTWGRRKFSRKVGS